MAWKDASRASMRPKKVSTNRRATWVDSTRSTGRWKVATLSAREWRSAVDDALGAHGSCTWTTSNGAVSSSSSIVRDRSTGTLGMARRGDSVGSSSPTARTSGRSSPARIRRRDSRTSSGECDGAATTTLCPRARSSADSAPTCSLTACASSHGYGVTCAILSGTPPTLRRASARAPEAAIMAGCIRARPMPRRSTSARRWTAWTGRRRRSAPPRRGRRASARRCASSSIRASRCGWGGARS